MANKGKRYTAAAKTVNPDNRYGLSEAVKLVKGNAKAKFDETIEIAMNLGVDPRHADQMVRGVVTMPSGTGKTVRVAVFAKGGQVEFRVEKAGLIHAGIGKASFTEDQLLANVKAFIDAVLKAKPTGVKGHYVKKIALSSTMGPGVRIELSDALGGTAEKAAA